MISKIVLFFEYVGERREKDGKWQQKFYQLNVVFDNLKSTKRNAECVSCDEANEQNYNSFPVFYGENHEQ